MVPAADSYLLLDDSRFWVLKIRKVVKGKLSKYELLIGLLGCLYLGE
jgi:hypothetical protein